MAIKTRQQLLAWDLVEGLGDEAHKGIYFRLAKIYDEGFLREILSNVKNARNEGKIKSKDCGRYFMGILSSSAKATEDKKKKIYDKNIKNSTRKRSDFKKKSGTGKKSRKSGS
ncbi:hypothetical protein KKH14_03165 [Patescibacteria group bacterium]|nr:hypothetical protein [Patescibacteria group bacterium]